MNETKTQTEITGWGATPIQDAMRKQAAASQYTPKRIRGRKIQALVPPTAPTEAPHIAQYGEGVSKFYAAKRGSETVATYKLGPDQRDEVNQLIEEAQNDIEAVLFRLVAQRDELLAALKDSVKFISENHSLLANRKANAMDCQLRAAIAKAEGSAQ